MEEVAKTKPKKATDIIPVVENLKPDPGNLRKAREGGEVEEDLGGIITDEL